MSLELFIKINEILDQLSTDDLQNKSSQLLTKEINPFLKKHKDLPPAAYSGAFDSGLWSLKLTQDSKGRSLLTYPLFCFLLKQQSGSPHPMHGMDQVISQAVELILCLNQQSISLDHPWFLDSFKLSDDVYKLDALKKAISSIKADELKSPENLSILLKHSFPEDFVLTYQTLSSLNKLSPSLLSMIQHCDYAVKLFYPRENALTLLSANMAVLDELGLGTDDIIKQILDHYEPGELISAFIQTGREPASLGGYQKILSHCARPAAFIEGAKLLEEANVHDDSLKLLMSENEAPLDIARSYCHLQHHDLLHPGTMAIMRSFISKPRKYNSNEDSYLQFAQALVRGEGFQLSGDPVLLSKIKEHNAPFALVKSLAKLFEAAARHDGLWNELLIDFICSKPQEKVFYEHLEELTDLIIELALSPMNANLPVVCNIISHHKNPISAAKAYTHLSRLSPQVAQIVARNIITNSHPFILNEAIFILQQAELVDQFSAKILRLGERASVVAEGYVSYLQAGIDISLPIIEEILTVAARPVEFVWLAKILSQANGLQSKSQASWSGALTKHLRGPSADFFNVVDLLGRQKIELNENIIFKIITHPDLLHLYQLCQVLIDFKKLNKINLLSLLNHKSLPALHSMLNHLVEHDLINSKHIPSLLKCKKIPALMRLSQLLVDNQQLVYTLIELPEGVISELDVLASVVFINHHNRSLAEAVFLWALKNHGGIMKAIHFAQGQPAMLLPDWQAKIPLILTHESPLILVNVLNFLFQKGLYEGENINMVVNHTQLTDLCSALQKIGDRKISQFYFNFIWDSHNPVERAEVYNILQDHRILLLNDFRSIIAHPKPVSRALALVSLLQTPRNHWLVSNVAILDYADPMAFCSLLNELDAKGLLIDEVMQLLHHHQEEVDFTNVREFILCVAKLHFVDASCYGLVANAALNNHHLPCLTQLLNAFSQQLDKNKFERILHQRYRWLLTQEAYDGVWMRLPPNLSNEQFDRLLFAVRPNGNQADRVFNAVMMDGNLANDAQNTHKASVHKTAAESAMRLQNRYHLEPEQIDSHIDDLYQLVRDQDFSKADLAIQNFLEDQKEAALRAISRLSRKSNSGGEVFIEPLSHVGLREQMALIFLALSDDTVLTSSKEDAIASVTHSFYRIQRGYNSEDAENNILSTPDAPICLSGTFNQNIQGLVSIHPDCEILMMDASTALLSLPRIVTTVANEVLAAEKAEIANRVEAQLFNERLSKIKEEGYGLMLLRMIEKVKALFFTQFAIIYPDPTAQAPIDIIVEGIKYAEVDEKYLDDLMLVIPQMPSVADLGMFALENRMDASDNENDYEPPAAKRPKMGEQ